MSLVLIFTLNMIKSIVITNSQMLPGDADTVCFTDLLDSVVSSRYQFSSVMECTQNIHRDGDMYCEVNPDGRQ